jgi:hypothetical protein
MTSEVPKNIENKVISFLMTRIPIGSDIILSGHRDGIISEAVHRFDLSWDDVYKIGANHKIFNNGSNGGKSKSSGTPVNSLSMPISDNGLSKKLVDLRNEGFTLNMLRRIYICHPFMMMDFSKYKWGSGRDALNALKKEGVTVSGATIENDLKRLRKAGVTNWNQIDPTSFHGVGKAVNQPVDDPKSTIDSKPPKADSNSVKAEARPDEFLEESKCIETLRAIIAKQEIQLAQDKNDLEVLLNAKAARERLRARS